MAAKKTTKKTKQTTKKQTKHSSPKVIENEFLFLSIVAASGLLSTIMLVASY